MKLNANIGNIGESPFRQDQINATPLIVPHFVVGPVFILTGGPIQVRGGQGTLVDVLLAVRVETVGVVDLPAVPLDPVDGAWTAEALASVGQDTE